MRGMLKIDEQQVTDLLQQCGLYRKSALYYFTGLRSIHRGWRCLF